MEKLNPSCDWLFARPLRKTQNVIHNIHNLDTWYEKTKVGKNLIGAFLPKLSVALGLERFTNDRIRPTSIRLLKRAEFSDRQMMSLTRHKSVGTLQNYDPSPTLKVHAGMATAISNAGSEQDQETPKTNSSKVGKKTNSRDQALSSGVLVALGGQDSTPADPGEVDPGEGSSSTGPPMKRIKTTSRDTSIEALTQGTTSNVEDPLLLYLHREQQLANQQQQLTNQRIEVFKELLKKRK